MSDFLCRNNIFLFLRALVSHFELSESQVFCPEDLYLCQDIGKVFRTLAELSHTSKVQRSGVSGFPKKEKQLNKKLKTEQSNYEALGKNGFVCLSKVGLDVSTIYLQIFVTFAFSKYFIFLGQMYGEAGTEYIYHSFSTKVRLRDKDLCYNEDIYQTIFPPKQQRLSLADISFGGVKKVNNQITSYILGTSAITSFSHVLKRVSGKILTF